MGANRKTYRKDLEITWTGTNAAKYDESRRKSPTGKYFAISRRRAYGLLLDRVPRGKAIEIAAGTGLVTQDLLERGFQVVATDISDDMLTQLRRKVAQFAAEHRCEIHNENAFALSQESGKFDLAVCVGFLTWINASAELQTGFREAARMLRPGGLYLFNYRNHLSPQNFFTQGHGFSRAQIRSMLAQAGLTVVGARNGSHFRLKFWRSRFGAGKIMLALDRLLDALKSPFAWHVYVLARKV